MVNGVLEVWVESIHEAVEGVCIQLITEGNYTVVHEVPIFIGWVSVSGKC